MRLFGSLFGAAALIGVASSASAAEPVEYVRICDVFGSGYFYIPGTDTCLKVGGRVRYESHYVDQVDGNEIIEDPEFNNWTSRARANVAWDARTQTGIGLVRSFIELQFLIGPADFGDGYSDTVPILSEAYIQVINESGLFTIGHTASMFDFWGSNTFGTRVSIDDPTLEQHQFAYTRVFGGGFSASLSVEDPLSKSRRSNSDQAGFDDLNGNGFSDLPDELGTDDYEGQEFPDFVGNLRVDQGWGSAQVMGVVRHIHDVEGLNVGFGVPPGDFETNASGDASSIGWAFGAGLSVNLPFAGMILSSQGGYSEGAIGYVTGDPLSKVFFGELQAGDFVGPEADGRETKAWSVRGGLSGQFTPTWGFSIDGSYTEVDTALTEDSVGPLDSVDYRHYAAVGNIIWEPAAGLQFGWEVGYENLFLEDEADIDPLSADRFDAIGGMFRIERAF